MSCTNPSTIDDDDDDECDGELNGATLISIFLESVL